MKIAGVQKTSLIDYPKQVASIIFTQGCNLSCPYCHNPELIPLSQAEESYYSVDSVLNFLQDRRGFIDGVVITGGEPTLQEGLIQFITRIKNQNLKVKLDTNGNKPGVLAKLITNGLLDYIALDVKSPLSKLEMVTGSKQLKEKITESIDLIKSSPLDYEFRTTVVPTLHDNKTIEQIGQLISGAKQHYIQNFRAKNTFKAEFTEIKPFPPEKLDEFKEILLNYVQQVAIRNK